MLLATYALLTLSAEQKKERTFIETILQYLRANQEKPQEIDPECLKSQLDELTQFAETRHKRKIEGCLMPALRKATRDADSVLADLQSLNRAGSNMLRSVRKRLRRAFGQGAAHMKLLCRSMERYCQNLLDRLTKEEEELMPLAQRVISSDDWFTIGTMFLTHDANYDELKRLAQPRYTLLA
jgi:hemerythrin-like domain-containing protein